jgi:anti-sigma factor ChrR (cupin superfamily)
MLRFFGSLGAVLAVVVSTGLIAASRGHDKGDAMKASIYQPGALKWVDGPRSLPPGVKIALLEGDPAKQGPFVFRLKLPDGYRIPPHTHPKAERLTVLSGEFHIGMGDKFDSTKGEKMPAGTYGTWPAGMKHFVWVKGETVIQLHGEGPWQIRYLNPDDDPRRGKE